MSYERVNLKTTLFNKRSRTLRSLLAQSITTSLKQMGFKKAVHSAKNTSQYVFYTLDAGERSFTLNVSDSFVGGGKTGSTKNNKILPFVGRSIYGEPFWMSACSEAQPLPKIRIEVSDEKTIHELTMDFLSVVRGAMKACGEQINRCKSCSRISFVPSAGCQFCNVQEKLLPADNAFSETYVGPILSELLCKPSMVSFDKEGYPVSIRHMRSRYVRRRKGLEQEFGKSASWVTSEAGRIHLERRGAKPSGPSQWIEALGMLSEEHGPMVGGKLNRFLMNMDLL